MQIIPTSSSNINGAFFSGMDWSSQNASDFFDTMQSAINAVDAGEYVSADTALAEEDEPQVESPYTRHTTDGVTYTLSEVCFTKEELLELRAQLLKEGAREESLKQFDILADQPAGATLAQVMASLMGSGKAPEIDEEMEHSITALLGQIDPTGQLATDALDFMRRGNGLGALNLIQEALGKLDATDGLDIDAEGLLALGRGLGLNADSLRNLINGMGGNGSLRLNADQFDTLLNPAKNQFLTEAANAEKLDAALEKTLKPIIRKARDRMEKEQAASELQNRRVEQSRILIDKTVQERSRQIMDETVTGEAQPLDKDVPLADLRQMEKAKMRESATNAGLDRENSTNARQVVNMPDQRVENRQTAGDDAGSGLMNDQNRGKSDAWQNLLGKLDAKVSQNTGMGLNSSSAVYSMLQNNVMQEPFAAVNQLLEGEAQLSQRLASQVQQGMLTAMRDGSTRLDLQLHPAELGTIAITLVARNGEVTARIRSEKSETAEMVNRQLDAIRVNLEQQGVRVDKIEVQLEDKQDHAGNLFQDLGQHNARQEEDARRQALDRLRNLASVRNNSLNMEESALAQSMHIVGQSARYAGQALHVVA